MTLVPSANPLTLDWAAWRRLGLALWTRVAQWLEAEPLVAALCLLAGAAAGLAVHRVVGPRRYVAALSLTVAGTPFPDSLAQALAFQEALLTSDPVLDSVLLAARHQRLLDLLTPPGSDQRARLTAARQRLRADLTIDRDERDHILTLTCVDADSAVPPAVLAQLPGALADANRSLLASLLPPRVAFFSEEIDALRTALRRTRDPLLRNDGLRRLAAAEDSLLNVRGQGRYGVQISILQPVTASSKPLRPQRNTALVLGALLLAGLRLVSRSRGFAGAVRADLPPTAMRAG